MYDRLITIEKRTKGKSASGAPVSTWAVVGNRFAHISYKGGNMDTGNEALRARTDATFTIRYDSTIDYNCRILYEQDIYQIRHIEVMGRKEKMLLQCIQFEDEK